MIATGIKATWLSVGEVKVYLAELADNVRGVKPTHAVLN